MYRNTYSYLMNRKTLKVRKTGTSLAVTVPKEWADGMRIEEGTEVEALYDGVLTIRVPRPPPEERLLKELEAGASP